MKKAPLEFCIMLNFPEIGIADEDPLINVTLRQLMLAHHHVLKEQARFAALTPPQPYLHPLEGHCVSSSRRLPVPCFMGCPVPIFGEKRAIIFFALVFDKKRR
jgi:hypothetical protein